MYMQVTSPTTDSTIRLQLNFHSPAIATSEAGRSTDAELLFWSRVHEVLHTSATSTAFLVVCQPAPNAFVLVPKQSNHAPALSDSVAPSTGSRPRFRVIIGPQLCSCSEPLLSSASATGGSADPSERSESRGPQVPCVHIVFVLFRVLRAPLDDPSLALVPLPTTKAESLIQAHLERKHINQSPLVTKGQRCYLSQIPVGELKATPSGAPNRIHPSCLSPVPVVPLAMPKPIHASQIQSNSPLDDRTPRLLAAMHSTLQNSPDCCELSKLTTGIRPSTRQEAVSADAAAAPSTTTASRTSSIESTDSSATAAGGAHRRTVRSARGGTDTARGTGTERTNSLARRPRTVPQPEPPPRTNHVTTRPMRHACSTTFRPIRDHSPIVAPPIERKLTPIRSEETSAENSLKHNVCLPDEHRCESVHRSHEHGCTQTGSRRAGTFRHWHSGLFKPVAGANSTSRCALINPTTTTELITDRSDSKAGTVDPVPIVLETFRPTCALCLQPLDDAGPRTETVLQCQSNGHSQRCVAAFHRSCCQIWLEEAAVDGDSPHCPVCFSHWDTVPFDWPTQSTVELHPSPSDCSESDAAFPLPDRTQTGNRDYMNAVNLSSNSTTDQHEQNGPTAKLSDENGDRDSAVRESIPVESKPVTACLPSSTSANLNCPFPDYNLCVSAFSLEIADGIASKTCPQIRQIALQHAAHLTVRRILWARQQHQRQVQKDQDVSASPDEFRDARKQHTHSHTQANESTEEPDCLRIMFRLIQHLFDDPVDAVFINALRAFRELLGYLVCFNTETQTALQRAIGPIIRRLLRFAGGASILWSVRQHPYRAVPAHPVLMHQNSTDSMSADSASAATSGTGLGLSMSQVDVSAANGLPMVAPNLPDPSALRPANQSVLSQAEPQCTAPPANLRDRANLALASLVELAKGQAGALAIGRDVGCASGCLPVCGLHHMTRFVLSSAKFHATHLVGRLTLLDKLIRMDQAISPSSVDPNQLLLPSKLLPSPGQPTPQTSAPDRLARRHLCSSLVFARRHLIPPASNSSMVVCVPRLYEWQQATGCPRITNTQEACAIDPVSSGNSQHDAMDSLYNTQLKASRVARRVFLTAARALLTYDSRHASDWNHVTNGNCPGAGKPIQQPNYGTREFCPREFVELEISRTEPPLAAWLRNKLASLLYPNLVPGLDTPLIPIRMTVSEAQPSVPPRNLQYTRQNNANQNQNQCANDNNYNKINVTGRRPTLPTSQTLGNVLGTLHQQAQPVTTTTTTIATNSPRSRTHSNSPVPGIPSAGEAVDLPSLGSLPQSPSHPPVPPPRRPVCLDFDGCGRVDPRHQREISASRVDVKPDWNDWARRNSWALERLDCNSSAGQQQGPGTHCVRIALEPAYDLVPLSESGNYSSVSEGEEEEEEEDDLDPNKPDTHVDVTGADAEPTYGGRSLGSEAELQTEQAAVLRSALRRCSRSLRPLLPVPALSMVMDAFRSTNRIPSTDEYYESIDWVRGPILGQGAFSQCYQARDTRTGLLMAVKRIRLGGGSVFPILTDQAQLNRCNTRRLSPPTAPPAPPAPPAPSLPQQQPGEADAKRTSPTPTCVKLSPEAAAQLAEVQAEVNIMLRLSHPNVLRLFGAVYCARRGLVDLFIEWMPGGSVTSLLRQYGAFNESVTLAYGVQVVRGLAYLHKNGILHRDLKGANLLVDTTGSVVRISDFGASARLSGEESVTGQFQGQVIGTFSFMAPEVLRGETYGRACDIWSVGCCLIEMLTSKPPWHDTRLTNRYALMFAIATSLSPPTYPEGLDPDVLSVLNACFARDATQRPTASKLLTFRAFARLTEPAIATDQYESDRSSAVARLRSPSLPQGASISGSWTGANRRARRRAVSPRGNTDSTTGGRDDPADGVDQALTNSSTVLQQQQQQSSQLGRRRVTQPILHATRVL